MNNRFSKKICRVAAISSLLVGLVMFASAARAATTLPTLADVSALAAFDAGSAPALAVAGERGGVFDVRAANAAPPVDNGLVFALRDGRRAVRQWDKKQVEARWFGIDNTGAADCSSLLNGLLGQYQVLLAPGKYRLDRTVFIGKDGSLIGSSSAPGSCVLQSKITDGTPVIAFLPIDDPNVGSTPAKIIADSLYKTTLRDIEIQGTGPAQNCVGIEVRNSTQILHHVTVRNMKTGMRYVANNTYLVTVRDSTFAGCTTGVLFDPVTPEGNSGENLVMEDCFIIGNSQGVRAYNGWMIKLLNTSIDYNQQQFVMVNQPDLQLIGCHVEWSSGTPMLAGENGANAGRLAMHGGALINAGPNPQAPSVDNLLAVSCGPRSAVVLHDVIYGTAEHYDAAFSRASQPQPVQLGGEYINIGYTNIRVYLEVRFNPTATQSAELRPFLSRSIPWKPAGMDIEPLPRVARAAGSAAGNIESYVLDVPVNWTWKFTGQNVEIVSSRIITVG